MAYNKIIYGGKTLIDLTGDTVTQATLLKGVQAHDKRGIKITGTLFADHPDAYEVIDAIEGSAGESIADSSGLVVNSRTIYLKA